ncbi:MULTISPECIES: hypothetical protein [Pseudomonas]|uniref:hypothetical protein n=1 Tax=Pseudomonas TaxID=286 RepID=UPI001F234564|nr:hypothetical protein [Pseudomonas sputi]
MSANLITNGDFESGSFTPWIAQALQGKADVVNHNRSFQAQLQPGVDNGILLYTQFEAPSGPFTLSFSASAPTAQYYLPPFDYVTHPFLVYFISGFDAGGQLIQTDFGLAPLQPTDTVFKYSGNMPADVKRVEVRFSGPSDPDKNKGPLYIDTVNYTSGQALSKRWS